MCDKSSTSAPVLSTSAVIRRIIAEPQARWFICASTSANRSVANAVAEALQLLVAVDALVVESKKLDFLLLTNPGPARVIATEPSPEVSQLESFIGYWSIVIGDLSLTLSFVEHLSA